MKLIHPKHSIHRDSTPLSVYISTIPLTVPEAIFTIFTAQTQEFVTVGLTTFGNTKYYPTNCENSKIGEKTNEFWTYLTPSSSDARNPDNKFYVYRTGNLWWEGNSNVYVTSNITNRPADKMQVLLNSEAHSKPAGALVGGLQHTATGVDSPCYVTPADQVRVDFFNGWVCYRLYTCSPIPHIVTTIVVGDNKVLLDCQQSPYESLMRGLVGQISSAGGQIPKMPNYDQTFTDMSGNSLTFVVEVSVNGPYSLF